MNPDRRRSRRQLVSGLVIIGLLCAVVASPALGAKAKAKATKAAKASKKQSKLKPAKAPNALGLKAPNSPPRPLAFGGESPQPLMVDGLKLTGQVVGREIRVATPTGMKPHFWAGVNLGATLPGTSPGELAPTRADYDRWFAQMGEMGSTILRVYTILPPHFYDAVRDYNLANPKQPLFILHGVWIPEDRIYEVQNLWDVEVIKDFHRELADAVGAVHGDLVRPIRRGHASGTYTSDISQWVIGWSVGVEWDPDIVLQTNEKNKTMPPYVGKYFTLKENASPTEIWIATGLDIVAALEVARGWSRPMTFTNWVSTDPVKHPEEPFETEDIATVDATRFASTPAWPGGFFASYHAYPYYPDGLRFQKSYIDYRTPDGRPDQYAAYLNDLRTYHGGQAIMITEFGQPSSIGLAHRGPNGRDQGGHQESVSAANNTSMMKAIHDNDYAGAVIFEWTDEWFKFTWNSVEHELPKDRRAMWRNPLTNEEHFGVIAMEAGETQKVVLDGDDREWTDAQSKVIATSKGPITEIRANHDEESLYLRVKFAKTSDKKSPWTNQELGVGIDLHREGNGGLPGKPGVLPEADVAVMIGPGNTAKLRIAAWLDPVPFEMGVARKYMPVVASELVPGSGAWRDPSQVVSKPLTIPSTGEELGIDIIPFGNLRWGSNDPTKPGFDDRNLVNGAGSVLELRLPWGMIGMSDPSLKLALRPQAGGKMVGVPFDRIGIAVAGPDAATDATTDATTKTAGYTWDNWNVVKWHERKKVGWETYQRLMYQYL
jgi:hypothetical protein